MTVETFALLGFFFAGGGLFYLLGGFDHFVRFLSGCVSGAAFAWAWVFFNLLRTTHEEIGVVGGVVVVMFLIMAIAIGVASLARAINRGGDE